MDYGTLFYKKEQKKRKSLPDLKNSKHSENTNKDVEASLRRKENNREKGLW